MAETQLAASRPDLDIHEEIQRSLIGYAPWMNDRHRVQTDVKDGVVHVSGHVKTPMTHHYVLNTIQRAAGVQGVVADEFYNDEALRLVVAAVAPMGVLVFLEYGAVILTGRMPEDMTVEELVRDVALVPGVHRVITNFKVSAA